MNSPQRIRIGTSEVDGTFWSEGTAIAGLLERDHGIASDILDAGQASIENGQRLDTGLIELGFMACLLYTSPSPRDGLLSRMPSSA